MHYAAAPLNHRGSANCMEAWASIKAIKVKTERIWLTQRHEGTKGFHVGTWVLRGWIESNQSNQTSLRHFGRESYLGPQPGARSRGARADGFMAWVVVGPDRRHWGFELEVRRFFPPIFQAWGRRFPIGRICCLCFHKRGPCRHRFECPAKNAGKAHGGIGGGCLSYKRCRAVRRLASSPDMPRAVSTRFACSRP